VHTYSRILKVVTRDGKIGLYLFKGRSVLSRRAGNEEDGGAIHTHTHAHTHTDMENGGGGDDGLYTVTFEIEPVPPSRHIIGVPERK
jgi:hypothetical protein